MDAYTKELLALAVEAAPSHDIKVGQGGYADGPWAWHVASPSFNRTGNWFGPTLADALAALLRDLGVEVPERPSAERVAEIEAPSLGYFRTLYRCEPLIALAILEGGAS